MKDLFFISSVGKGHAISLAEISYIQTSSTAVSAFIKDKEVVLPGQAAALLYGHLENPLFVKVNHDTFVSASEILNVQDNSVSIQGKTFLLDIACKSAAVAAFRRKTEEEFNAMISQNSIPSYGIAKTR